jgi:hypothetical protein
MISAEPIFLFLVPHFPLSKQIPDAFCSEEFGKTGLIAPFTSSGRL